MSIYTNDIDTLRQMISQSMTQLFSSVITIVSVLAAMIMINVPLTLVTLFMVGVTLLVTKKVAGLSELLYSAAEGSGKSKWSY